MPRGGDVLTRWSTSPVATALVLMAGWACGPVISPPAASLSLHDALVAPPEELELAPADERAALFDRMIARSREQALAQACDGPSVLALERDGHLVPAAFPWAAGLDGAPTTPVDLDQSRDPWPADARAGLGGLSEREAAEAVAGALVAGLALPEGPGVAVDREPEAPYAAAFVEGRLHLNPAVLYLAAARSLPSSVLPLPSVEPAVGRSVSCATAVAEPTIWLAGAGLWVALRRRRRGQ